MKKTKINKKDERLTLFLKAYYHVRLFFIMHDAMIDQLFSEGRINKAQEDLLNRDFDQRERTLQYLHGEIAKMIGEKVDSPLVMEYIEMAMENDPYNLFLKSNDKTESPDFNLN